MKMLDYFFKYYWEIASVISSSILLILIHPGYAIIAALCWTGFFITKKSYKSIFFFWFAFIFIWYLAFMGCALGLHGNILFDYAGDNMTTLSYEIILKYHSKYYWSNRVLENFCLDTLLIIDTFQEKANIDIYLPSIYEVGSFIGYSIIFYVIIGIILKFFSIKD